MLWLVSKPSESTLPRRRPWWCLTDTKSGGHPFPVPIRARLLSVLVNIVSSQHLRIFWQNSYALYAEKGTSGQRRN